MAGIELGFHRQDGEKNRNGGSPVVYFGVQSLDEVRASLLAAGCVPDRGPIEAEPGRWICQLVDPFGVVIGLDGAR